MAPGAQLKVWLPSRQCKQICWEVFTQMGCQGMFEDPGEPQLCSDSQYSKIYRIDCSFMTSFELPNKQKLSNLLRGVHIWAVRTGLRTIDYSPQTCPDSPYCDTSQAECSLLLRHRARDTISRGWGGQPFLNFLNFLIFLNQKSMDLLTVSAFFKCF